MEDNKLKMSFDPHTIEHLGIKMYSILPNAIAELIANAYDAEAQTVYIRLSDIDGQKNISVTDDGVGMTFDEINDKFLRIGRKRRDDDNGLSPNGKRKVTGRKGLGKLAFFGIGDTIEIETRKNGSCIKFTLSWSDLTRTTTQEYEPKFTISQCADDLTGTTIILKDLKRKSEFDKIGLAVSLSKLFNFFDDTFEVYITQNGDEELKIDNKLKYQNLISQIEWIFPNNQDVNNEYINTKNITGKILATEKPLKPGLRGITLFAHGRLVNAPEFFGVGESSHGYSYFTGWLNVDFVDEWEEDVISTDRQSLSWDLALTAELQANLRVLLSSIERDWRNKRKIERQKKISEKSNFDVTKWYDTLPSDIKSDVENIVNSIVESSELGNEQQSDVVNMLHKLMPEYPYYHWRHIHNSVRDASYEDYQNADYYRAAEEAIKRYETTTKTKSGLSKNGKDLMAQVFGKDNLLSVTAKYKKSDGNDFSNETKENIEEGQKFMSMGMMSGVRNPLAHEEKRQLKESNLFTEKDCLDILSLLSHLFRRLDDA